VRRRSIPHDEWQYHQRSSEAVRGTLLRLCLEFVRAARKMPHVHRMAVVGSLPTPKPRPKDADVLVTIGREVDLDALAVLGRRFQRKAQGINSTADVFLSDVNGSYVGRVCHYRDCHPRARCRARHCGSRSHLNDDLDVVTLAPELIASPPVVVHPVVMVAADVPQDVEDLLLAPLRRDFVVSAPSSGIGAPAI
jgi:hypothetical protein